MDHSIPCGDGKIRVYGGNVEGIVRPRVRETDGKVRLSLSRKGHIEPKWRLHSNWHESSQAAFECIQKKCDSYGFDVPAMSHRGSVETGVHCIHQIYGLYRDGRAMSELFKLSFSAWQAYAKRNQCEYKL